ncbi:hypothetical protein BGX28_009264 [Mortierella sp. GBA30]|nr:hypothetical protein BGX28_009264 [Mortierella sp. GBA30]
MEHTLQEKFALVQQMKREKELKEAKAKDNPIDIFALAGVNIPGASGWTGGDSSSGRNDGKRLRMDRASSSTYGRGGVNAARRPSQSSSSSSVTSPLGKSELVEEELGTGPGAGAVAEKKLKRSSMAARNSAQRQDSTRNGVQSVHSPREVHSVDQTRDRQLSISSVTSCGSVSSYPVINSPSTVTPPTPIPSPVTEDSQANKQDATSKKRSRSNSQHFVELARDMTHNVAHSRANSVDENEEMVLDSYGRSIPRSRHQSSEGGSDYENERARYEREPHRRRSEYDDDCTYRSPSPNSDTPLGASEVAVDPYVAASRYLDTAFYQTKIYVGHLPESASLTSLRTAFAPFGEIEDMNLVEGKDFGFVTFKEQEAARRALEAMNGVVVEGVVIKVNRAMIPERNRRGFAGVAWTDEDGELAKLEEEQHRQAAALAGNFLSSSRGSSGVKFASEFKVADSVLPSVGAGASYGTRGPSHVTPTVARPVHQLPPRPRSPKLPPKPTGAAAFPPAEIDSRAAVTVQGRGRRILSYEDL